MTRSSLFVLAVASTLIAALGVVFLDLPVSRWVAAHEQSDLWGPIVDALDHAAGISPSEWIAPVVLCAGVLASLVIPRWHGHARSWMYVTIVYLVCRNVMGWGKTLTGRYRPHQWLKLGGDTFGHVGDGASFPSGHVVVYAGMLIPLAVVAPRTRPLLVLVPFIMIARVAVLAHFVSDVFASLALTALVAWACVPVLASSAPPIVTDGRARS